ncbi:MAG: OsmC family protein [Candidatus Kapabacteria bacterium]|nr:OsmC family protein [Candidatus Kapabacteria bacterium]
MVHAITATWTDGLHFEALQQGRIIHLDSALDGEARGVSPKQLLLTAVAGCTGMDVASLLPKFRIPFSSLVVRVNGELTEEHPKVYRTITIEYEVGANEEHRPLVERAVSMSAEKYCGVSAMLGATAAISHAIVLTGYAGTADAADVETNHQ